MRSREIVGKVHLLSLGCPKNLVDSENLLKKLKDRGVYYSSDPEAADIIMINTCGFIDAAKRESIEEILKAVESKGRNKGKKIVVYGCLAKRSGQELKREIPEIDALWGVGEEDTIAEYCRKIIPPVLVPDGEMGDVAEDRNEKLSDKPYAYLKIAEGCHRNCTYCIIPKIRGRYKSRVPEDILTEAEGFVKSGIKELIVVAQDITSYGNDIKGYDLGRLVRDISSIPGDFWVRLLYLYPTSIDTKLLDTIASEEKVCKYIDMPLQHSEEKILRLMGRGGGRPFFENLVSGIREVIPDVNIRTTFIVGFPGETEEDFEGLLSFVRKARFDRLGAFTYSKEDGTTAFTLKGQVLKRVKMQRYNRIMEVQSAVSLEKNKSLVGKRFKALVDEVDNNIAISRIYSQAPDIDGVVIIENCVAKKGSFVDVEITEAYDYDLKGAVVK
jgi:ribosomal protein S12 methylthiotransferase